MLDEMLQATIRGNLYKMDPENVQDRRCDICHKLILRPTDHDPAHHVATAYHVPKDGLCISCSQPYPCPTRQQYGADL